MQPENNLYANLKTLMWSAIVGVLSFQILAPLVWGHMHRLMGIPNAWAYWIFVFVYTFMLPCLICYWIIKYREELRKCLHPFGMDEIDKPNLFFLNGMMINAVLQIIIGVIFLINEKIPIVYFEAFQILNAAFCLLLMIIGCYISYMRISLYERPEEEKRGLYIKYKETVISCVLIFLLLAATGTTHLLLKGKDSYIKTSSRDDGLALIDLQDSIRKVKGEVDEMRNRSLMVSRNDTLRSIKLINNEPVKNEKIAIQKDKIYKLPLQEATRSLTDSTRKPVVTSHYEREVVRLRYSPFVSLLHEKKDSTSIFWMSAGNVPLLQRYIENVERDLNYQVRRELGIRLRNTQVKVLFILLDLFFCLLALYIFLRIDDAIVRDELSNLQGQKRLRAFSGREHELLEIEKKLIEKEDHQATSSKISSGAWLHLAICVWLLVPLFKPVEDDKINVETPFKMLTINNAYQVLPYERPSPPPQCPDCCNNNFKIDTLIIEADGKGTCTIPQSMLDDIAIIRKKVEKIKSKIIPP